MHVLCCLLGCALLFFASRSAQNKGGAVHVVVYRDIAHWEGTVYHRRVKFQARNATVTVLLAYRVSEVPWVYVHSSAGVEVKRPEELNSPDLYLGLEPRQPSWATAWFWEDRLELELLHTETCLVLQLACPSIRDVRYLQHGPSSGHCQLREATAASTNTSSSPCGVPGPRPHPLPASSLPPTQASLATGKGHFPRHVRSAGREPRSPQREQARSCLVTFYADHLFYNFYAYSDVSAVIRVMRAMVAYADDIFRDTDFNSNGLGDNIGFEIANVVVLKDFRAAGMFADKQEDSEKMLSMFSNFPGLPRNMCVNAALTYRIWDGSTLGIAWIGKFRGNTILTGICATFQSFGGNNGVFNTALVNALYQVARSVSELSFTLVHEIGHSFGAYHDDNTDCATRDKTTAHIMNSRELPMTYPNNKRFSRCSLKDMGFLINKGMCLVLGAVRCGNGRVEAEEQCDCGSPKACAVNDPCCNPPGSPGECRLKPRAACSPVQSKCCTTSCALWTASEKHECQEETECAYGVNCDGRSPDCPKPVPMADGHRCGGGSKICRRGFCNVSVCEASKDLIACSCVFSRDACKVCCRKEGESACRPAQVMGLKDPYNRMLFLEDGDSCLNGEGYCRNKECIVQTLPDFPYAFSDSMMIKEMKIWVRSHWYYFFMMAVLILIAIIIATVAQGYLQEDPHVAAVKTGQMQSMEETHTWCRSSMNSNMTKLDKVVEDLVILEWMGVSNAVTESTEAVGRLRTFFPGARVQDALTVANISTSEDMAVAFLLCCGFKLQMFKLAANQATRFKFTSEHKLKRRKKKKPPAQ